MPDAAQGWIDHLDLEPHPEGGYYRETYRTNESIPEQALPERFNGVRDVATLIYFLLPADSFSALHRSPTAVGPRSGTSTPGRPSHCTRSLRTGATRPRCWDAT